MIDTTYMKARRERLKLSQDAAAKLAGIGTRVHWNRIERGRVKAVRPATLVGIAKALKCPLKRLLSRG